jgi:hypothetical protein
VWIGVFRDLFLTEITLSWVFDEDVSRFCELTDKDLPCSFLTIIRDPGRREMRLSEL